MDDTLEVLNEAGSDPAVPEISSDEQKIEKKHQKFRTVAVKNTELILKSLRLLQSISNANSYYHTDAEGEKMMSAIRSEFDKTIAAYEPKVEPVPFSFD